jgi:hypothetical protein
VSDNLTDDSPRPRRIEEELRGTAVEWQLGVWSARSVLVLSVAYAVTLAIGFIALGNLHDPLPDPYRAIAEVLILVLAPAMVALMAAIQACAPRATRVWATMALGWVLAAATVTMTVHLVELTVARRIPAGVVPGQARLLGFEWPSVLYAVDVAAWDLFLGISLICAAFVFTGRRRAAARRGLLLSGALCLVGLVGPATDVLAWRAIGILGYILVFPLTCLGLSRAFSSGSGEATARPPRDPAPARTVGPDVARAGRREAEALRP